MQKLAILTSGMPPNFRNAAANEDDSRTAALQTIAYELGMRRRLGQSNDEQAVFTIISWNDVVLPNFRMA